MKILVLTPDPPTPLKPRVFRFAKILSTVHDVHIAFVDPIHGRDVPAGILHPAERELQEMGVKIHRLFGNWSHAAPVVLWNLLRGLPFRVALYEREELRRQVESLVALVSPDLIHVDRERAYAMSSHVSIPIVVDLTDPVGWYLERRAAFERSFRATLLKLESKRVWSYERKITQEVAGAFFASEFGAEMFRSRLPQAQVRVIPVPLPTPIPRVSTSVQLPGTSPHICFVGNLYYHPNVQAIVDFANSCWRSVRACLPGATLHIAGSHPHMSVRKLSDHEGGIYVHNTPADMGAFLRACDLSVAPIQLCAGFSNKVVDAVMEGEIPVIASPEALVGFPSQVRRVVPQASRAEEWIDLINQLCRAPDLRHEIVQNTREALQHCLSPNLVLAELNAMYDLARGAS